MRVNSLSNSYFSVPSFGIYSDRQPFAAKRIPVKKDSFERNTQINAQNYLNEIEKGNALISYRESKHHVLSYKKDGKIVDVELFKPGTETARMLLKNPDLAERLFLSPDSRGKSIAEDISIINLTNILTVFKKNREFLKKIANVQDENGKALIIESSRRKLKIYQIIFDTFKADDKEFTKEFLLKNNPLHYVQENNSKLGAIIFDENFVEFLNSINNTFKEDKDFIYNFYSQKNKDGKPYIDRFRGYIVGSGKRYISTFFSSFKNSPESIEKLLKIKYQDGEFLAQKIPLEVLTDYIKCFYDQPEKCAKFLLMKNGDGEYLFAEEKSSYKKHAFAVRTKNILEKNGLSEKSQKEISDLIEEIKINYARPKESRYIKIPKFKVNKKISSEEKREFEQKWLTKNSFGLNKIQLMVLSNPNNKTKEEIFGEFANYKDVLRKGLCESYANGNTTLHIASTDLLRVMSKIYNEEPEILCKMLLQKNKDGKYPIDVKSKTTGEILCKMARKMATLCPDYEEELKRIYKI